MTGALRIFVAIDSPKACRVAATLGDRSYLHCTGLGKAIAAAGRDYRVGHAEASSGCTSAA